MIPWLGFEKRWRQSLMEAMLPQLEGLKIPEGFWPLFQRSAPPLLRFGIRAATWALTFTPPLVLGRMRLFPGLSADQKDELLIRLNTHRSFVARQMVVALKLVACFAYFHEPSARKPFLEAVHHAEPRS